MGLVPNHEFMRINTKVVRVYFVLEKKPYTKNGVKLLKTSFLACHARISELG